MNLGSSQDADKYFQQAVSIYRLTQNRPGEVISLRYLGLLNYKLRRVEDAIGYLNQATKISDSLRVNLQDGYKVSLFQGQVNDYKLLATAHMEQGNMADSLIATERGRARAFLDLIAQKQNSKISTDAVDIQQIQNQAKSRQATIVSYSVLPDWNTDLEKSHKLLIHVVTPEGKLIAREVSLPKNVDLQGLIRSNRASLERSGDSSRGTLLMELKEGMTVRLNDDPTDQPPNRKIVSIDRGKQEVTLENENGIRDIVKSDQIAHINSNVKPYLRQLHELLIEPVADLLPTSERSPIIFIPDGVLYEVPFAALQDAKNFYLIDSHTISVSPSIAVLSQTAQLQQRPISKLANTIVVGNPDFTRQQEYRDLKPLKYSEEEANMIGQLLGSSPFIGSAATKAALLPKLPSARIIHFATHGVPDLNNGINSAIVLAGTANDSGFLNAKEVISMKLSADLVVLSACETGLGKITGDGVIGLSRSFIAAGTNTVVVSLWSVNDKSTAVLMSNFYQELAAGRSKAQALRNAMLKTKAKYFNPYFWSGMTLIGEP
jgi:CHAT domain-containing protein